MNTTTAIRRNTLLTQQDIRLPASLPGGTLPATHDIPRHDFLVLNQHPDFTTEVFLRPAPAALRKT